MTDTDLDARLAALFGDAPPLADARFAQRVIALAAYDLALRRSRRRALTRVAREAAALGAALGAFWLLARAPGDVLTGFGDSMPIASPAMLGVTLLALWGIASARDWTAV